MYRKSIILAGWNNYDQIVSDNLLFVDMQMLFIGIIGEYLSYIISKSSRMPLVVELERINFD